jgi:DNA-binding SARP family transcriptional activator/TolB-like protein
MNSGPTFSLRLFGSPSIVGEDGSVLGGPAVQRHRLALLALLALSPGKGVGRERLTSYLWPESDTEHARRLLNQAVYALRKALGEEALLSDLNDLRLNGERIRADVADFEAAVARTEYERAVGLYSGPFLDGFFLRDRPEFERWVGRERERLAGAYWKALEALAHAAERERDFAKAVELWRTRAAHDPYDSRVARRLILALDAGGNRGGALQHALKHEQLLRGEFGAEPAPELLALAERLRTEPTSQASPAGAGRRVSDGAPASAGRRSTPLSLHEVDTASAPPPADVSPAPPPATSPARPGLRRPAVRYGVAVLLLAAALFGALRGGTAVTGGAIPAAREPSIAVLPLANPSTDPRHAALADGMTEELIATLARVGNVRVIASTSVSGFRGHAMDVRDIADSLGVSHIVEGGFRVLGSRLSVEVRLVDGRDGSTRWSETYDREFADVFSVQSEIAQAVAGELGLRFDSERQLLRHKTRSIAAYELYLLGWDPRLLRGEAGLWKSLDYFQQAIAADSTYAAAHAGVALMQVRRARTASDPEMPLPKVLALAEDAARRAVALDDSLAEAHYALAQVLEAKLDFPSAELEIRRAIALDPTRSVYRRRLAYLHGWSGRADQELAEARRALETDPLNPYALTAVAGGLFGVGRYDEALAQLERVSAIKPPLQGAAFAAAQCYAKKQMWGEAIAALRPRAEAGDPMFVALLGYMLARAGQREEAERILVDLLARRERTGAGAFQIAMVQTGLGDLDETFAWLDRSVDDYTISSMIMGPTFEDLHRDPRFQRLRERLGVQKR